MVRDPLIPIPVVYMGGCCGDLLSSLIDWQDSTFNILQRKMVLPEQRQRLKKHHLFANDMEKDSFLREILAKYASVPSHDLDYHAARAHWFIGIAVEDPSLALWAAHRFKDVHRPAVWQQIENLLQIEHWEEYAQVILDYSGLIKSKTDHIIYLEDIVAGHGLERLENLLGQELRSPGTSNAYRNWQHMINGRMLS